MIAQRDPDDLEEFSDKIMRQTGAKEKGNQAKAPTGSGIAAKETPMSIGPGDSMTEAAASRIDQS
jgi:hypothetical protein